MQTNVCLHFLTYMKDESGPAAAESDSWTCNRSLSRAHRTNDGSEGGTQELGST